MENMFLGIILLSAHVLIVLSAPISPSQEDCVAGEPQPGQSEPDVNITVSSTTIPELGNLSISCNAINVSTPLLPVKITIHIGRFEVAACDAPGIDSVFQCSFNVQTYFPILSRTVSCTAEDAEGRCRFKTANITLLQATTTVTTLPTTTTTPPTTTATATPAGNMTTDKPTTNGQASFSTSQSLKLVTLVLLTAVASF